MVLREALQRDVDRALQLFGRRVDDVGEDAALRGLVDVGGVVGGEERDHGTGRFAHDLRDQLERVIRIRAESDECNVRPFPLGDGTDLLDVDLACDHLVPETGHDLREQFEPVAFLVRDQYAEMTSTVVHEEKVAPFVLWRYGRRVAP